MFNQLEDTNVFTSPSSPPLMRAMGASFHVCDAVGTAQSMLLETDSLFIISF